MHVEIRKAGDVVIVDLKGKLTAGLGDQILRDTIDELLAENWKKILLNLSGVSFMDSAGRGRAGGRAAHGPAPRREPQAAERQRRACSRRSTSRSCLPIFELYSDEARGPRPVRPSGTSTDARSVIPPRRSTARR